MSADDRDDEDESLELDMAGEEELSDARVPQARPGLDAGCGAARRRRGRLEAYGDLDLARPGPRRVHGSRRVPILHPAPRREGADSEEQGHQAPE